MAEWEPKLPTELVLELADILQEEWQFYKNHERPASKQDMAKLASKIFRMLQNRCTPADLALFQSRCPCSQTY